ncbi:MAG: YfiR/HmsC family protein [Thermodesulfobacteriota bacterium]
MSDRYATYHEGRGPLKALCLALVLCLWAAAGFGGERDVRRAWVGLELFPTLLAADMDITARQDASGALPVLLLYRDDPATALDMADRLRRIDRVRGLSLRIETAGLDSLDNLGALSPAGVFLTQSAGDDLERVAAFCRERGILLFSPFEGDVENGAAAGIRVSDRIQPYVNLEAVRASGLRLKPFFLQVAVVYE